MQNLKERPRTKPVQLRFIVHKALKEYAAAAEKDMGEIVAESLLSFPEYRVILQEVEQKQ